MVAAAGIIALGSGVAYGAGSQSSSDHPEGGGRPSWVDVDGSIDRSEIPRLIPVVDSDGNQVGFIRREVLYPELFGTVKSPAQLAAEAGPEEVIDSSGRVVGHMNPGVGFVRLGEAAGPDRSTGSESRLQEDRAKQE